VTTRTTPDRRTVITGITDRLTHPTAPDDDYGPRSRRWWAQSIAHGAAGVAILHACLDRTGENRQLIHRWLAAAVTEELSAAPGAGAWFGAPAVAFAFAHCAPDGTYRGARAELDRALQDIARDRLDEARRRIQARKRPRLQEFDLVNGLAGIGGYLLQRDPSDAHRLVAQVLSYLVALTEPVDAADAAGTTVPGWWTADPPSGCPTARGGHSDQGAAHGICGPLSLLALAGRAGIWVPGQHQAMQRIGDWYDGLARTNDTDCWWPQRLTWHERTGATPMQVSPGRPSWCYSTPGIARALQLSGIALGDTDRQHRAEQALLAAVTDPTLLGQISDVSLCHGWAGTALTVWCAAQDSTDPALTEALPALTDSLAAAAHALPGTAPTGLIHGAAGAALTLNSLTVNQVEGWARYLLLF
jgi:hypothetical protein